MKQKEVHLFVPFFLARACVWYMRGVRACVYPNAKLMVCADVDVVHAVSTTALYTMWLARK